MDRRKPGQSKFTTQRKESDKIVILIRCLFQGKTTGTPISIIIYNEDKRSRDYETIKDNLDQGTLISLILKNME